MFNSKGDIADSFKGIIAKERLDGFELESKEGYVKVLRPTGSALVITKEEGIFRYNCIKENK